MQGDISKEKLLKRLEAGFSELIEFLRSLTNDQMIKPNKNDWSIKDFIIHFTKWEDGISNLLNKKPRYESMGIPKQIWETDNYDLINETIKQNHSHYSPSEAIAMFQDANSKLVEIIEKLDISDLLKPYNYYDKDSKITKPVVGWIIGNSFGHFSDHLPKLRDMVIDA